jgi:prohibitin 2
MARYEEETSPLFKWISAMIILAVIIVIIISAINIVPAGFRGVLLVWGAAQEQPFDQGLHFIIPIADSVVQMDLRTQKYEAKAEAATKDLLDVTTDVAVNYHVDPSKVVEIYKLRGTAYQDSIINPAVQEVVKAATANFNAKELITERPLVKTAIDDALTTRLSIYGIVLETTSITDFTFPQSFNEAITAAQTATQNAIQAQNQLLVVQYQAQQAIAQANGTATATLIQAQATAQSIEIRGKALKENPQVATLEWINKWNGILPNYMMGSATPLLNIGGSTLTAGGSGG